MFEINLDENVLKVVSSMEVISYLLTHLKFVLFYLDCSHRNPGNMIKNVVRIQLPVPTTIVVELVLIFLQLKMFERPTSTCNPSKYSS